MLEKFPYCLILVFLAIQPAFGQETVYVEADGQTGRGLLKSRGSECFVITPGHVVEDMLNEASITGAKSVKSQAALERMFSDDLALLRITGGGNQNCNEWSSHRLLNDIIEKSIEGVLEVKGSNGSNKLIKVLITEKEDTRFVVRPYFQDEIIRKGYSGSTLFTLHEAEKVILGMLMEVDQDGKGIILSQKIIANNLASFFNVKQTLEATNAPTSSLDLNSAILSLDRATNSRDGTYQGQVQAIELLINNGYIFINKDFKGVALGKAKFENTDLSSCDFQTCELEDASYKNSVLTNSNFNFSNFSNADFSGCQSTNSLFNYARGMGSNFSSVNLTNSSFFITDLSGANFNNAILDDAIFAYCDITKATFTNASLKNTVFLNCILTEASFIDAKIKNINITNSVSKNNIFSNDQQFELKRFPRIRYFSFEIFNKEKSAQYPNRYASFSNEKLGAIPYRTHWSLDIWDPSLRAKGVVGPLHYYSLPQSSGDIRGRTVFDTDFWHSGGRSKKITTWLDNFIDRIIEKSASVPVVQGNGSEFKKFNSLMEENIKRTSYANAIVIDTDASIVLHRAVGMNPASRGGIVYSDEDSWWKSASIIRCNSEKDKDFMSESSWGNIFPESSTCDDYMPLRHYEYYKEWVEARAYELNAPIIESRHSLDITHENFKQLLNIEKINRYDSLLLFPFASTDGNSPLEKLFKLETPGSQNLRNDYLNRQGITLNPLEFDKSESDKVIQLREYGDFIIEFPNLRSNYFLKLDSRIDSIINYNRSFNFYHFSIQYQVTKLESRNDRLIIFSEPKLASFLLNGKTVWSGEFHIKQ